MSEKKMKGGVLTGKTKYNKNSSHINKNNDIQKIVIADIILEHKLCGISIKNS